MPEFNSASEFGTKLLAELGVKQSLLGNADHPAIAWKRCGLLELSGNKKHHPMMVPVPLASAADGAMLALKSFAKHPEALPLNGALLLGERARLMGLTRNGKNSSSGYCRLINTNEGRIALNLARDDDWGLLEAWLEEPASSWDDVVRIAQLRNAGELVERGCELGLAIAHDSIPLPQPWFEEISYLKTDNSQRMPFVVDLSSLWAGPLAANLLHYMGAKVVKVESLSRSDGARRGNTQFYDLLNVGKRCAAFDFNSSNGLDDIKKLITAADIVIESSRPRALKQLGIDADKMLQQKPGKLWLRFMADKTKENRIGFGDDIGVSAGLSSIMESAWGQPCFVGDAIADPLSGIFGALAAWTKWQTGGGVIINLSMRDVVRCAMQVRNENQDWPAIALQSIASGWQAIAATNSDELYPMRQAFGKAEDLGESTSTVMANLC